MIRIFDIAFKDPFAAKMKVIQAKDEILKKANDQDPVLVSFGGGAKDLEAKVIQTTVGPMLITELHVDCRDAMGANAVNTMSEAISPKIEELTGGHVYLRIISNLATKRLAKAWCTVPKESVGGEEVVDGIVNASASLRQIPIVQLPTTRRNERNNRGHHGSDQATGYRRPPDCGAESTNELADTVAAASIPNGCEKRARTCRRDRLRVSAV
jgi:hypothetical protein